MGYDKAERRAIMAEMRKTIGAVFGTTLTSYYVFSDRRKTHQRIKLWGPSFGKASVSQIVTIIQSYMVVRGMTDIRVEEVPRSPGLGATSVAIRFPYKEA